MTHSLDLHFKIWNDERGFFDMIICEPKSGFAAKWEFPLSFDEHPEFNEWIGNEIYSWIAIWADGK